MLCRFLLSLTLGAANLLPLNQLQDEWESTETIWNFGIITECTKGIGQSPFRYFSSEPYFERAAYQDIQSGDIVWLPCRFVSAFSSEVLPQVQHPFVLVISDGDESFPSECGIDIESFIDDEKIIHIFAQNCDYSGKSTKVSHLPIGLDFHTIAYKGGGNWGSPATPKKQEEELKEIITKLQPTHLRRIGAFVDFQWNDTTQANYKRFLEWGESRISIFERLLPTGLMDFSHPMKRAELWRRKGAYAFSISPYGNGMDCHRTWEDLSLGCIVIVKTSPIDPLYQGLPVVIVKDWSEITRDNMEKWLDQYGDAFTNPEYRIKLTNAYWLQKIRAAAMPYASPAQ
jgi:hypothetical protein